MGVQIVESHVKMCEIMKTTILVSGNESNEEEDGY